MLTNSLRFGLEKKNQIDFLTFFISTIFHFICYNRLFEGFLIVFQFLEKRFLQSLLFSVKRYNFNTDQDQVWCYWWVQENWRNQFYTKQDWKVKSYYGNCHIVAIVIWLYNQLLVQSICLDLVHDELKILKCSKCKTEIWVFLLSWCLV